MTPEHHAPGPSGRAAADERFMRQALALAAAAGDTGEVPVGALVVRGDDVISSAANAMRSRGALAHAELLALQAAAGAGGNERLDGVTLYVTLEPCAMCAGAIVLARVARVVFGAWDEKAGMAGSVGDLLRHPRLNHTPEVQGGVLEVESSQLLTRFFRQRRG